MQTFAQNGRFCYTMSVSISINKYKGEDNESKDYRD